MRLGSVGRGGSAFVVAVVGESWLDLRGILPAGDLRALDMKALIAAWPSTRPVIESAIASGLGPTLPADPALLAPPVGSPGKILCIGRNYAQHAIEQHAAVPQAPEIFLKLCSTLLEPYGDIVLPPGLPQVDFESELVVVIGAGGRGLPRERGFDAVFGWTVGNDVSVRSLQHRGTQWTPGKNFDRTAPLGPYIVTRDELPDPRDCRVHTELAEGEMQTGYVREMLFDIPTLIEDISRFTTLEPGDLIFTGTPPGVGEGRTPPRWLAAGDVLVSAVEGVGALRNRCVQG